MPTQFLTKKMIIKIEAAAMLELHFYLENKVNKFSELMPKHILIEKI